MYRTEKKIKPDYDPVELSNDLATADIQQQCIDAETISCHLVHSEQLCIFANNKRISPYTSIIGTDISIFPIM